MEFCIGHIRDICLRASVPKIYFPTLKDGLYIETGPWILHSTSPPPTLTNLLSPQEQMSMKCESKSNNFQWRKGSRKCCLQNVGHLVKVRMCQKLTTEKRLRKVTSTGCVFSFNITNLSVILDEIQAFSFNKIHLKMLSAAVQWFCTDLNMLIKNNNNNYHNDNNNNDSNNDNDSAAQSRKSWVAQRTIHGGSLGGPCNLWVVRIRYSQKWQWTNNIVMWP